MTPEMTEALDILRDTILNIIENDSHTWGTRPCQSCQTISSIIKKPFGCIAHTLKSRTRTVRN